MKIKFLTTLFFCLFLWSCSNAAPQYAVVVDAGSSSSRVHLFSFEPTVGLNQNPHIQEMNFYGANANKSLTPITSTDTNAPLDTFKSPIELALTHLQGMSVSEENVSVYIYSTAGMRLLDQTKRAEINQAIAQRLKDEHPKLKKVEVRTISGQEEALYAWLDVNYLSGTISPNSTPANEANGTMGTIDIGGASTQIAYETTLAEATNYKVTQLNLFGKKYHLYLNSILGGGQDQMRKQMNSHFSSLSLSNPCYIAGSDESVPNASFNAQRCQKEYDTILSSTFAKSENPKNKSLIPAPPSSMHFVGTSSIFYSYNFFGAAKNADVRVQSLQGDYQSKCHNNWRAFKRAFPEANEKFLSQQCANAVYIHHLLTTGAYNLDDNAIITVSTADWASGAILMISSGTLE